MEYYRLRQSGDDIDLVVHTEDHLVLQNKFPNNIKEIYGDIGVCEFGFEAWNQICTFDYEYLKQGAIEKDSFLVISLERLLFLKSLAIKVPKCHKDLHLIVELILNNAYSK
jgi:hypothetical protein